MLRSLWGGGPETDSILPDFTLKDLTGGAHALSEDPQRLTVLWFTNLCEDCQSKIPLLNELVRDAGDRYRVLAVSILAPADTLPLKVAPACDFPILLDPEDIVDRKLGLSHPPGTCPIHNLFIVSPSRRILFRHHLSALGRENFVSVWRRLRRA